MRLKIKDKPRVFKVGKNQDIEIQDHGDIYLAPDEQVTFVTELGARHDFARKDWGFYATPSVNGRLSTEGFKTALVRNKENRLYIMVVEEVRMKHFAKYCKDESQEIISWLDEYSGQKE